MPRLLFEVNFKKAYKTYVKHTILNLVYALLNHHEAPRTHKPHECHLEGPWGHLGASCGPSGGHLSLSGGHQGVLWGPSRGFMGAFWQFNNKKCKPRLMQTCRFYTNVSPNTQPHGSKPSEFVIASCHFQQELIILQPGPAECAKPLKSAAALRR